jgi:nucleotide-binding universal stress UspA family protein
MFEKVLFPMDFSSYALRAMDCLAEIPGIKEVIILHVIDTSKIAHGEETEATLTKKAELELSEQKRRLESLGFTVKTKVRVGIAPKEIIKTSREENISLIVMGARGRSLIKDILLGSVSSNVVRYGNTNVLIMRHKVVKHLEGDIFEKYCDRIFSRVLFPTDFSENAENSLSIIKQIRDLYAVVLVHVIDKGKTKEELNKAAQEAETRLKERKRELTDSGITTTFHVHIGNPAYEINKVAEEEYVSLIAMSTTGKGIIEEMRIGSTMEEVVRNAKRPVLVLST